MSLRKQMLIKNAQSDDQINSFPESRSTPDLGSSANLVTSDSSEKLIQSSSMSSIVVAPISNKSLESSGLHHSQSSVRLKSAPYNPDDDLFSNQAKKAEQGSWADLMIKDYSEREVQYNYSPWEVIKRFSMLQPPRKSHESIEITGRIKRMRETRRMTRKTKMFIALAVFAILGGAVLAIVYAISLNTTKRSKVVINSSEIYSTTPIGFAVAAATTSNNWLPVVDSYSSTQVSYFTYPSSSSTSATSLAPSSGSMIYAAPSSLGSVTYSSSQTSPNFYSSSSTSSLVSTGIVTASQTTQSSYTTSTSSISGTTVSTTSQLSNVAIPLSTTITFSTTTFSSISSSATSKTTSTTIADLSPSKTSPSYAVRTLAGGGPSNPLNKPQGIDINQISGTIYI